MTTEDIESFLLTAQYLSFSEAAKQQYITQSAVSRRIARLERDLGAMLFVRESSKLCLTEAGKILYEGARDLMTRAQSLREAVCKAQMGESGVLRMACNYNSQTQKVLNEICMRMQRTYPNITMQVNWIFAGQAVKQLTSGNADVVMCEECEICELSDARIIPLVRRNWVLFMRKDHPLANRESVDIEELGDYDMVFWDRSISPCLYDSFFSICYSKNIDLHITLSGLMSSEDILLAVLSKKGIAVSSNGYASVMQDIIEVKLTGIPNSPDYAVGYTYLSRNPALFSLIKELDKLARELHR